MIYLDHGATSFPKPLSVRRQVQDAMARCGNSGRGGHGPAMEAARTIYLCRTAAADFFDCVPEQVVFTSGCTHSLNIALRSLFKKGERVAISGFEHNAVTRPLYAMGVETVVAGRKLFDWADTLEQFENVLKKGVSGAVFTHCSNVFGYILPVEEMAFLCRKYQVPFVVDGAQSAGCLPISLRNWGASFVAMSGHKGLLGPMGTGLLLCGDTPVPLMQGGTGSRSESVEMPSFLPDLAEVGTMNVGGIAGVHAGLSLVKRMGLSKILHREQQAAERCVKGLKQLGHQVFSGAHQNGTVSFVPRMDCEELAEKLGSKGIAVRGGLHCAPLAHESAGTLATGTVRLSFGHEATVEQAERFLSVLTRI